MDFRQHLLDQIILNMLVLHDWIGCRAVADSA